MRVPSKGLLERLNLGSNIFTALGLSAVMGISKNFLRPSH